MWVKLELRFQVRKIIKVQFSLTNQKKGMQEIYKSPAFVSLE